LTAKQTNPSAKEQDTARTWKIYMDSFHLAVFRIHQAKMIKADGHLIIMSKGWAAHVWRHGSN
ncbi:hypothetical protein BAE44_0026061, partial [Dichanthelium oligosanthes]